MGPLDNDSALRLIARLVDLTYEGKLTWVKAKFGGEESDFDFRVRVGEFQYGIGSNDKDDARPYTFLVRRREGGEFTTIQRISSAAPGMLDVQAPLYETVKQLVMGYDEMAQSMFNDLDSL